MKGLPAIAPERTQSTAPPSNAFPITVKMFHEMIDAGILTREDRCELIEGELRRKEPMNPPHAHLVGLLVKWFVRNLGDEWLVRPQVPVTFDDSEPQPDFAIVRDLSAEYATRHPGVDDIALLVEVADSSLQYDRVRKLALYARVGVPAYWIVNLPDKQIETFSQPTTAGKKPKYARRRAYKPGAHVPLVLDGVEVARLKVDSVFKK